jgi:hypothetical protein
MFHSFNFTLFLERDGHGVDFRTAATEHRMKVESAEAGAAIGHGHAYQLNANERPTDSI